MKQALQLTAIMLLIVFAGCTERAGETDTGGILLEVEFDQSTFRIGVNDTDLVTLPQVTIDSIVSRPGGGSSSLMDVQLNTIELTYQRADTGTRVPLPFVYNVVGTVPAGGQLSYSNIPIMTVEQLRGEPLADLLFQNGAVDSETGASIIKLNVTMRVFGQTLAGVDVASVPRSQTFEFVPSLTTNF